MTIVTILKTLGGNHVRFGDTLKNLRELNHVTQQDLANRLGVSRATIAGYETKNHQPDYEKLEKIARFFHVSIDYLLTGEDAFRIENTPKHTINERLLDAEVLNLYKTLNIASKEDALKYLKLLQVFEKQQK